MTPMETPPKEPDELTIDPFVIMDQIRSNPHIQPEKLAEIEKVHEAFVRIGTFHADDARIAEALWLAYFHGTIIGAYTATRDPEMLEKISGLQQSSRAKNPRQRAWVDPAKELAINLRSDNPRLSQEQLAEKIRKLLSPSVKCPGVDTIVDHISDWEREGALPKMQR